MAVSVSRSKTATHFLAARRLILVAIAMIAMLENLHAQRYRTYKISPEVEAALQQTDGRWKVSDILLRKTLELVPEDQQMYIVKRSDIIRQTLRKNGLDVAHDNDGNPRVFSNSGIPILAAYVKTDNDTRTIEVPNLARVNEKLEEARPLTEKLHEANKLEEGQFFLRTVPFGYVDGLIGLIVYVWDALENRVLYVGMPGGSEDEYEVSKEFARRLLVEPEIAATLHSQIPLGQCSSALAGAFSGVTNPLKTTELVEVK